MVLALDPQMPTKKSNSSYQSSDESGVIQPLELNGFHLRLSGESFTARRMTLPDNSRLKELRREHQDWILSWREGTLYSVPRVVTPRTEVGEQTLLRSKEHLSLIASLIDEFLPLKFPKYEAFRKRPFVFIGKKEEIVAASARNLRSPHQLLRHFTIRPTFMLEAKIIEPIPDETVIGLFASISTKWETNADLEALKTAGIDLRGLYVIRRSPKEDERRLVGQIANVDNGIVSLAASFGGETTANVNEVFLEGSKASFSRCLKALLGRDYEHFENSRQREESKLLNGPAINQLLKQFHSFFSKDPKLRLTEDLEVTIGNQLTVGEGEGYQSVHRAAPVQYYFNPSRTKTHQFPWLGIKQYGPFSKDTFPKRSPNILVVFPDSAQGATETFLKSFKDGVTSQREYEGGFAKLFGLINPSFALCKVKLLNAREIAKTYRDAIEEYLASSQTAPDAAIVVLNDLHSNLPDDISPYLIAKATLMMSGVPTQEIRVSKLSSSPYELQYILQNFSIALYAKMNGTPWTVNQDTTISDELIIGLGTSESSASRFDKKTRYVGVTTVFRGDGNYLLGHVSKECSYDEYPQMLKDTTEKVLQDLKQRNGWAPGDNVRLIFHTYKPLKNVEVAEIVKRAALAVGSDQTIEFAFLTVTVDHPFLVLDPSQKGIATKTSTKGVLVPDRGIILQIGRYTRLVCTNGPQLMKHDQAPLPAPLLVHIHKGSTFHDLTYLSEQVLKFTGLSWRSTLPAKRPVSIYYSELIAQLLGRLRAVSDWSPAVLNVKLRASRWFL
jgi:hypothetical protein